jgi:site-specific recombinase XerD
MQSKSQIIEKSTLTKEEKSMEPKHPLNHIHPETPRKIRDQINGTTTLQQAFEALKIVNSWSKNTLTSYANNVASLEDLMLKEKLEPILQNIDFELAKQWVTFLKVEKRVKSMTIKQKIATMSSIFSDLIKLGVLETNPFLLIKVAITDAGYHSRVLNLEELFEIIYALRTESELADIEIPISLGLYTGFRNTNLCRLTADSISHVEKGIKYGAVEVNEEGLDDNTVGEQELTNSKNKKGFIPLPPLLHDKVTNYIKDLNLKGEDSLLYGLQGKPLANKQLNHMVKKICIVLNWTGEKEITPYAFRYTFATIFAVMGVSEDAIRFGLGHSIEAAKGSVGRYIRLKEIYKKELKTAQIILEEVLETLFMLKEHHMMYLNLEQIFEDLKEVYKQQYKNNQSIHSFKSSLIEMAKQNKHMEMMGISGQALMTQPPQPFHQQNPYPNQPGLNTNGYQTYPAGPNLGGNPMAYHSYQMIPGMNYQQAGAFHPVASNGYPMQHQAYMPTTNTYFAPNSQGAMK